MQVERRGAVLDEFVGPGKAEADGKMIVLESSI